MFRIIVLSVILSSAIGYSLADWVAPSGPPPLGNTPPPINVGGASQVKEGNLFINNLLWAKKARSVSTTAADPDDTMVTKDYTKNMLQGACVQSRNPTCIWPPGCHNGTPDGPTQCTDAAVPQCECEVGYRKVITGGVDCVSVEAVSCVRE